MLSKNNLKNITVLTKNEHFLLSVKEEITVSELKKQIKSYTGVEVGLNYLFYNNINLLSYYDNQTLSKFFSTNSSSKDHIFYMINTKDYKQILDSEGVINCIEHPMNIGKITLLTLLTILLIKLVYLFCQDCNKLICDKCKILSHNDHTEVKDQVLVLNEVFLKLQEYISKFKESYSKIEENSGKINKTLGRELEDFYSEELSIIEQESDDLRVLVKSIKDIEIKRLDIKVKSGREKIKEYMNETEYIKDIFSYCTSNIEKRDSNIENFKNNKDVDEKISILTKMQKMSSELEMKEEKIKVVLTKLQNIENYNVPEILRVNRDHTYNIYTSKLKRILRLKLSKMQEKLASEEQENKYGEMEKVKDQLAVCKVYNQSLNLSNLTPKSQIIYQAVDEKKTVLSFNYVEKIIKYNEAKFTENVIRELKCEKFPRFSRCINMNNKLYITGGEIGKEVCSSFLEVDENFNVNLKHIMCSKRSGHSLLNLANKKLYAISGAYGERSCEYYDFDDELWKFFPPLKEDRVGASVIVYNDDTLYCFFGKRFNMETKKWDFISTAERVSLLGRHIMWEYIAFKNSMVENLVNRAFAGTICLPSNKILLIGGQVFENFEYRLCYDAIELDLEQFIIQPSDIKVPKKAAFLDTCFYYCDNNVIQFDNVGDIFLYSIVYNEFGYIES